MGWVKTRIETIRESLTVKQVLAIPFFVACIILIFRVAAILRDVGDMTLWGVPDWVWALWGGTLVLLFFIIEYATRLRLRIRGVRVGLSKLRTEGVNIRNDGEWVFQTQNELNAWQAKVIDWNKRVIEEIRKINEADAEWFSVLDVVEPPRVPIKLNQITYQMLQTLTWVDDQQRIYTQHDNRLSRLGEMVRSLWRE